MLTPMGNEELLGEDLTVRPAYDNPPEPAKSAWGRIPTGGKVAIIAGPIILIAGILAIVLSTAAAASPFESALDECGIQSGGDARLMDDGNALLLDTEGDESSGLQLATVACVLIALDVPQATMSRMDSTRALDGRQTDEFNGITVEWTYHPDEGMDVLFTR